MALELTVNGERHLVDVEPEMPLLWVLRDELALTGTKFGCGVGACGACTVHLDGAAVRSCVVPVGSVAGGTVTTIEALGGGAGGALHPVQRAWIEHQVPQCGYCQSGMVMAAAALLAADPEPGDEAIARALTNVCRCGTYERIRAAMRDAARRPGSEPR